MQETIFESRENSQDTLAGVFEFEDGVGYFYLYDLNKSDGNKILGTIHISNNIQDFANRKISIRWNTDQDIVALFLDENIEALFDTKNGKKFSKEDIQKKTVDVSSFEFSNV